MKPPPTIIVQRIAEACVFISPSPSLLNAKIVGNIIELNSPMNNKLHIDNSPSALIEMRMSRMTIDEESISTLAGANTLVRYAHIKRPIIAFPQ